MGDKSRDYDEEESALAWMHSYYQPWLVSGFLTTNKPHTAMGPMIKRTCLLPMEGWAKAGQRD
jgi:hypothetical protein